MPVSRLFGAVLVTSLSPKWMLPLVGWMNPATILSVVDLPQPEGPSRVKNSPSSMVTVRLETEGLAPGYCLLIPLRKTLVMDTPQRCC